MGGNVGVQSSAIIVQSLANNSLQMDSVAKRLGKEFSVGLINGIVLSVLIFLAGLALGLSVMLSLTVCFALFVVIIFAALFGTFVPLALHKYKIDPALATGPFITTTNDVVGMLIYFTIGTLLLA
jgi:magnesium transporter